MKNYTIQHLHSEHSNTNGFMDSVTNYKEYIKKAKELGMSSLAFSEHANVYDWILKKKECEKNGIKYIHGIEIYVCKELYNTNRGFHIGLYSKNLDGVLELNTLITKSTKKDGHFYKTSRITLEELINTSNNIIVTTACLGSPLSHWRKNEENKEELEILINFLSENRHRCFLEIQYHNVSEQIEYNQYLYKLHKKYDIPLIVGTDTHSLNQYHNECRIILQKSKRKNNKSNEKEIDDIEKENEVNLEQHFDLSFKSYDELIEMFKIQNSLPMDIILEATENTNTLANMVEDFDFDYTFKYPNLYENAPKMLLDDVRKSFDYKLKNNIIDKKNKDKYKALINEEFIAFKKQGMESFILFVSELLRYCQKENIPYNFARGSCAGSLIAYMLDITDVDTVVWKTVFSRFVNEDRISLCDIDIDFAPSDRKRIYEYIINRFGIDKCSYIVTFNKIKEKGVIDYIGRALNYELDEVKYIKDRIDELKEKLSRYINSIFDLDEHEELKYVEVSFKKKNIDKFLEFLNEKQQIELNNIVNQWDELTRTNKEMFYYYDGLFDTIVSKGKHPAGIIGSPITLYDNLCVFYQDGDENQPVSSCSMKAVDSLNYVKFDILGLKNIGIVANVCELANLNFFTDCRSHNINWNDEKVWNDMLKSNVGIFQFEGDFAFSLLKQFQPKQINDLSLINASLRPSGASYRNKLIAREFHSNPSKEIDELLKDNLGYLVFQEDTIKFLSEICGFTGSEADSVRRCLDENTLVMMGNGNYKKIKDIKIGDYVQSFNETNASEPKIVNNVFNNGQQETYTIYAESSLPIVATANHKVLTQHGWKMVKDLVKNNDYIMKPNKINSNKDSLRPNQRLSSDTMFLIGLLIGDGSLGDINSIHFTNSELKLINKYKHCISKLSRSNNEPIFKINNQKGATVDYIYSVYVTDDLYKNNLKEIIETYNLNHLANDKFIPDEFMSYPKGDKILNLLAGLFNTDGGYNTQLKSIEYYSKSRTLILQIQSLLLKYNITSSFFSKYNKEYQCNYYSLSIYNKSVNIFNKLITPYMIGRKKDDFMRIEQSQTGKYNYDYLLPKLYTDEIKINKLKSNKSFRFNGIEYKLSENVNNIKAHNIINEIYCPKTYELLSSDYYPVKIKKIVKNTEVSHVYDIEVEDNHNYVANGLIVHNCIGKKDEIELQKSLPRILDGYCNNSDKPREIAEKEAKEFVQIISDSSNYQFGYNHSTAYSMLGYLCAYLRYYYPLELTTAYLNNADNKEDIKNGISLIKQLGFELKDIEFGKSSSEYICDKKTNSIYKGIASIKFCNDQIAYELLELSKNKYDNFIDLINDINKFTTVNKKQLRILTILNFFKNYGNNKKLLEIIDLYDNLYNRSQIDQKTIENFKIDEDLLKKYSNKKTTKLYKELDMRGYIEEFSKSIQDKCLPIKEQCRLEYEVLEYINYTNDKISKNWFIVYEYTTYNNKNKPYLEIYNLKTGAILKTKILKSQQFALNPFNKWSIISCSFTKQNKKRNINGKWTEIDELEYIINEWEVVS